MTRANRRRRRWVRRLILAVVRGRVHPDDVDWMVYY